MTDTIRVLLTGVGSPGAPGIIKSLRVAGGFNIHIFGIDCNSSAVGLSMADRGAVCLRASDRRFIPEMLQLCKDENIDVVLSLVTDELAKLANAKHKFLANGTVVSVSDEESIRLACNKGTLFASLRRSGVPVPGFHIVRTSGQLLKAMLALGYPDKPVCFKPTYSDGSRGFHIVDARKDRFPSLFQEKPNSAYISYTELCEIIGGKKRLPELVVMEYLPYEEYSVDMLADRGRVLTAVPRLREATTGGISTRGTVVNERDVIEYTSDIVRLLKLHGNIGIQVKRDSARKPKIVEINPRMQGTIVHCTAAGINLPLLAVKLALGLPIADTELSSVQWGTRMVRYWEEVFYDADGSPYAL